MRKYKNSVIGITGTPGCGKSNLSRRLAKKINYRLIDLNKIVKKERLYDSYDRKKKCYVVDIKKVNRYMKKIKHKNIIIDSQM